MTAPRVVDVVVGLIEDDRGRLLVNRRRPGTRMAGYWEFPGGKREPTEARFDALRRELDEELGIDVLDASPWLILKHEYPAECVNLDVWRVRRYAGVPFGRENQALRWVEVEDLRAIGILPADLPIIDSLLAEQARRLSLDGQI